MKRQVSGHWGIMNSRSWLFVATAAVLILSILAIVNAASASSSANPLAGLHLSGNGDVNPIQPDGAFQVTPTPTPTPCSSVIQNGGFETGTLPPWTVLGTNPAPVVSTASPHSGTYSALLGTLTGPEPTGDSSIYQTITIPPDGGTLSYWWNGNTTDTINYDWQDAYVTSTSGTILDTIMHNCVTTGGYLNVTYNLGQYRGQTIRIEFLVHQDGVGDDTSMYIDDVALLTSCTTSTPSSSTNTPTDTSTPGVATNTPTPASTNVASNTPTPAPAATNTPQSTPTVCTIQYTDVPPGYWAYGYIKWAYCHGVVSGYADGTFRPENNTTRAQIAKMVVLAAQFPLVLPPGAPHFADVPPTNPFYIYVEVAWAHNVISGYADGTFHPYQYVTRAQLSKMIVVARGLPLITPPVPTFNDVPVSYWGYSFIETAAAHNIVGGYNCGGIGEPCPGRYFRPDRQATRAQLCKMLYQAWGLP